jgi:hypothetical protein
MDSKLSSIVGKEYISEVHQCMMAMMMMEVAKKMTVEKKEDNLHEDAG